MARKKVLLMGKAHSGKTSMRSIIFANYLARDTMRLSPTLDVEHHHVRFLGDLVLNLWDCGGQDAFYESYFERDRETIFRSVELLIYVFDIASDCPEKDFDHFAGVLEAIEENSPDARIFVLVHKMDLVAKEEQEMILDDRRRLIEESCAGCGVNNFQCFGTSIWDETLYKAWSEIVTNLIPNISVLQSHLDDFCRVCDADEVVLFERATFLVISHSTASDKGSSDGHLIANGNEGITGAAGAAINADSSTAANSTTTNNANVTSTTAMSSSTATTTNLTTEHSTNINQMNGSNPDGDEEDSPKDDTIDTSIVIADGENSLDNTFDNHTSVYSEVTTDKELQGMDGGNGKENGSTLDTVTGAESATNTNHQTTAITSNASPSNPATPSKPPTHFDTHRFEKISNIVKQFKLSCEKAQSQFQGMEVSNSRFSAFIDAFTANTYIMVIVSDMNVHTAATLMNIKNARRHFERFIPRS